jgi:hypothetical protein
VDLVKDAEISPSPISKAVIMYIDYENKNIKVLRCSAILPVFGSETERLRNLIYFNLI